MASLLPAVVSVQFSVPCKLFSGPSFGEVIHALQASEKVHLGVDNLNVVRHVGRLLDGLQLPRPLELEDDGDLIGLIRRIRGIGTVCFSKVKGHADEDLVRQGQVRDLDRDGNNRADDAADFGRSRVGPDGLDAKRNLSGVCGRWYPVVQVLQRFFIAISRAVGTDDGTAGTAPRPLCLVCWCLSQEVEGCVCCTGCCSATGACSDLGLWLGRRSSYISLLMMSAIGTLRWPASGADFGVGGVSYVELLILYELWDGGRLVVEKAVPMNGLVAQFQCWLFLLFQALIFGVLAASLVV